MLSPTWIVRPWPYLRGQFSKGLHCRDDLAAWEDCRISWEIGGLLLYEYDVLYTGWWLTYPSEKMMEWKSVGITIPDIWKHKIHVPNHQPEVIYKYKTPMNGPPMFVVKSKSVREKSGPPAGPPTDQPSCASEEDLEIFRKLLTSRLCENSAEGPICGSFQWEKPEEMCVATSKKMEKYINYQRC